MKTKTILSKIENKVINNFANNLSKEENNNIIKK